MLEYNSYSLGYAVASSDDVESIDERATASTGPDSYVRLGKENIFSV